MASNKLGDEGVQNLAESLASNTSLLFLDLFDVDFGNNSAYAF